MRLNPIHLLFPWVIHPHSSPSPQRRSYPVGRHHRCRAQKPVHQARGPVAHPPPTRGFPHAASATADAASPSPPSPPQVGMRGLTTMRCCPIRRTCACHRGLYGLGGLGGGGRGVSVSERQRGGGLCYGVHYVNRPFVWDIHGSATLITFCYVLCVAWCHRVPFSCSLRGNRGKINLCKFEVLTSNLVRHIRWCSVESEIPPPKVHT